MKKWIERHMDAIITTAFFVGTVLFIAAMFYADYTYKKAIMRDALREAAKAK